MTHDTAWCHRHAAVSRTCSYKPSHSLAMSFSTDPNLGLVARSLLWPGGRLPGDDDVHDAVDRRFRHAQDGAALIAS